MFDLTAKWGETQQTVSSWKKMKLKWPTISTECSIYYSSIQGTEHFLFHPIQQIAFPTLPYVTKMKKEMPHLQMI